MQVRKRCYALTRELALWPIRILNLQDRADAEHS